MGGAENKLDLVTGFRDVGLPTRRGCKPSKDVPPLTDQRKIKKKHPSSFQKVGFGNLALGLLELLQGILWRGGGKYFFCVFFKILANLAFFSFCVFPPGNFCI